MVEVFNFGAPATPDQSDGGQWYTLGCVFTSSVPGSVTGARWRAPTNAPGGQCRVVLFTQADQVNQAQSNLFTPVNGVDNDVSFVTPYSITAGTVYVIGVVTNRYAFTGGGWPFTSGPGGYMTAAAGSGATANGRFATTTPGVAVYPGTASGSAANFFIGPLLEPVTINVGVASVTGSAYPPQAGVASSVGVAAGSGSVTSAAGFVSTGGGLAAGSGVGNNAIALTAPAGNVAAGDGQALNATVSVEDTVHLYKFGPCEPWDATWPGGECDVRLLTGAAAVTGVAVEAASEILYQLTAQRFGLCRVKLRPCRQSCSATFPWYRWWEYGTYPQPYWWSGTWYNLTCGTCPGNSCSCVHLEETTLPGPVHDVVEVKVNGVVLTENVDYRIDDYRKLVRLGGELWPFCQNMNLEDTEVDTWSVTADYGEVVPALGRLAVGELASEIVKYLLCLDCALPAGVVDISRQGISMSIASIAELFNTGFINLRMCDLFIKSANPNHQKARSFVYDLDGPQHRATRTTP